MMGRKMDRANPFKAFDQDITSPATLDFAYRYGQLQCFIATWREKTFGKYPETMKDYDRFQAQYLRFIVEQNEFTEAVHNYQIFFGDAGAKQNVKKEMADMLVTLFNFADEIDCDLLFETMQVMRTNLAREWRSNGDGTGQHTKKAPWEEK